MKPAIFALFLFGSVLPCLATAQAVPSIDRLPDGRVTQLEVALDQVNQEQQSVYQQFQMVQELRRNVVRSTDPLMMQSMGGIKYAPPISYDEKIRAQRERQELVNQYSRDLNRLYARYSELAEQKKALLGQLMELAKESAR